MSTAEKEKSCAAVRSDWSTCSFHALPRLHTPSRTHVYGRPILLGSSSFHGVTAGSTEIPDAEG